MTHAMTVITKYIFLNALHCHTKGWFLCNEIGVTPPTPAVLIRMRQGQDIHRLARDRFPAGVFVGDLIAEKAINRTQKLLEDQRERLDRGPLAQCSRDALVGAQPVVHP